MERQNVTLSIPKETLRRARHVAVERGKSLSALPADCLGDLVRFESSRQRAAGRMRSRLKKAADLGSKGRKSWSREEIHER